MTRSGKSSSMCLTARSRRKFETRWKMLPKKTVEFFAHQSGIHNLEIAERDVVLTYALRLLQDSGHLARLAFKGGTCIRKILLGPTGRFSMDLDFTSREETEPENAILELLEVFNQECYGIQFSLEEAWRITQNQMSFTTQPSYCHDWNPDGGFDLQVSLREKPTLDVGTKPLIQQSYFRHLEIPLPQVPALDEHEIMAEKVRAAYQRAKVRDLHDLFVYSKRPLDRELVRRLAVIKLWQVRDVFDPDAFVTRLQTGAYDWNDLNQLIKSSERIDPEQVISQTVAGWTFLKELTEEEETLSADARAHREMHLWATLRDSCRNRRETGVF